jgi:hypothetical protein
MLCSVCGRARRRSRRPASETRHRMSALTTLAPHAPPWCQNLGVDRPASLISTQVGKGKSERLEPTASGIPKGAQRCSACLRHLSGRNPDPAPRRCHGLVSGHPSPVQTFAAAELEPTPCNFSSARRVLARQAPGSMGGPLGSGERIHTRSTGLDSFLSLRRIEKAKRKG